LDEKMRIEIADGFLTTGATDSADSAESPAGGPVFVLGGVVYHPADTLAVHATLRYFYPSFLFAQE
jgi:hypothetical protein